MEFHGTIPILNCFWFELAIRDKVITISTFSSLALTCQIINIKLENLIWHLSFDFENFNI
jgi:hypothetical protein